MIHTREHSRSRTSRMDPLYIPSLGEFSAISSPWRIHESPIASNGRHFRRGSCTDVFTLGQLRVGKLDTLVHAFEPIVPLLCLVFELLNVLGLQSRFGSTQPLASPLDEKHTPIESIIKLLCMCMFVVSYLFKTAQIFEHKVCVCVYVQYVLKRKGICKRKEADCISENKDRLFFL